MSITYNGTALHDQQLNTILKECGRYNIDPRFAIVQAYFETRWGTVGAGKTNNNWAGLTWFDGYKGNPEAKKESGGKRPADEGGRYVLYATADDGIKDWIYLLRPGNLYNVSGTTTITDYVKGLFKNGGNAKADYAGSGYTHYLKNMAEIYDGMKHLLQNLGGSTMAVTTVQLVAEIKKHVGVTKYSTAHKALVDYYNTQSKLPRGTRMTYDWDWCALFVSVVLMRLGLSAKYGTEISVGFYKQKFIDAKIWKGKVRPQVGDIIIWNWDESTSPGGWPDHIGFVTAVNGNSITTTEGNTFKNGVSLVGSNTYAWNATSIQGYARMDLGTVVNASMTLEQAVLAVLAGTMDNGAERIANIKAAGQDPDKVQAEINKRLTTATPPLPTKSVAEVAQEVIAGKWSSGSDRAEKLKNAGYDAVAVQQKVNELLKPVVYFSGHKNKIVLSEELIILDAVAGKRRGVATKGALIKFDEVYINDGLYIAYLNGDGERCYIKIAEMNGDKVGVISGDVSKS